MNVNGFPWCARLFHDGPLKRALARLDGASSCQVYLLARDPVPVTLPKLSLEHG